MIIFHKKVEWNNNQIKEKEIIDLSDVFSVWIKIIPYINNIKIQLI